MAMQRVKLTLDLPAAAALRIVCRDRLESVEASLRIVPCRTPITAAEFYDMGPADFPDDLRTVLIDQLRDILKSLEAALG